MKILMLSSIFPYPPTNGRIELRTYHLLKYLGSHHQVTLATQVPPNISGQDLETLRELVEELAIFPQVKPNPEEEGLLETAKRLATFIGQKKPPNVLSGYSTAMQQWVDEAVGTRDFDALCSEHSWSEIYVRPEWREQLGTVINIHRSLYGVCKHQLETHTSDNKLGDRLNLPLLRGYEEEYCDKFHIIVVMTEEDRKTLKELNPENKIAVIPNGVDLNLFPKRIANTGGQRIVLTGMMDNKANIDAAKFFSQEVFPEILARYPEATLEIVGGRPVEEVSALAELPSINVTGDVKSITEYLHWATVCVIPTRRGLGLQNKTLEAMAAGIPVVGSDRALAGLAVDGANVPLRAMRANNIEEYVYAIGRLFAEPKLREKLSVNGRALIKKEYTWQDMCQRYEQAILETIKM